MSKENQLDHLNIVIAGLGMMGGAFADGFSKFNHARITAYDKNEEVLEQALSDGIIQAGYSDDGIRDALRKADLVVVCLYPHHCTDFILSYMEDFKSGCILTDISGIKGFVLDEIEPLMRKDINYISGHPMAGSEKEGYGGATSAIFDDRNYILIPRETSTPESLNRFKNIIRKLGFTNIVETTPEIHDSKIAYTSQLCHVIASALIDGEDDLQITDYEGGSFADLTRIAMINAPMWTELFNSNKEALVHKIDGFMHSMMRLRTYINDQDDQALEKALREVRQKRIKMEIDRINKHRKLVDNAD